MFPLLLAAIVVTLAVTALLAWARPWAGFPLLVVLLGLVAWGFWFEPRHLTVERLELSVEGLAAPVRVVVIGDLQPSQLHWPLSRIERMVERAGDEQPDLVLWLGDYVYDDSPLMQRGLDILVQPDGIVRAMATLDAPMGSYAVLGNHDWDWNGPKMAELIRKTDIRLLINEAAIARHPATGAAIRIVGLDDIATGLRDPDPGIVAGASGDPPTLVLSHSPDAFPLLPEGFALAIAGHTHCGQVKLPLMGPLILPVEHERFSCGLISERGHRFFVTAGIGTAILPLRFLAPPEIAVLDLVPAANPGG